MPGSIPGMRDVAWGSVAVATAGCLAAAAVWVGTRDPGATPPSPSVTRLVGDVVLDAPDAEPPPPADVEDALPGGGSTPAGSPSTGASAGSVPAPGDGSGPAGSPPAAAGAIAPE